MDEVKFTIATPWPLDTYAMGESIACDGVCMTAIEWSLHELGSQFAFVASAELSPKPHSALGSK